MKKIQVLGPGCPKCEQLHRACQTAIDSLGLDCELSKVTDINEIVGFGVMLTPALVIDSKVVFSGRSMGVAELVNLFKEQAE